MNPIIAALVKDGISVEVSARDEILCYDLQTGMKSHCIIVEHPDGSLEAEMRYYEKRKIEDLSDVVAAVLACLHGRGFMSCQWESYFQKHGISCEGY